MYKDLRKKAFSISFGSLMGIWAASVVTSFANGVILAITGESKDSKKDE